MGFELAITATVGLLPVLIFLLALQYLDSYKLVHLHITLIVIAVGGLVAAACYCVNGQVTKEY